MQRALVERARDGDIDAFSQLAQASFPSHVDADLARGGRSMGLLYVAVFLVPLVFAFIVPMVSMLVYALIVLAFIAFTIVGRWEAVMVWRGRRRR